MKLLKMQKVKRIFEVLDDVCDIGTLEVVNSVEKNDIVIDIRQDDNSIKLDCKF